MELSITPDVVYGHKFGMALTFDVYQPRERNGAAVIFVNSAGWVSGIPNYYEQTAEGPRLLTDKELARMDPNFRQLSFRPLLAKGFTVFMVRHGSSPKFEMPEIVADLRRAVRFIRYHADSYGFDAERLGLWGGSAGGHLSLLLATTAHIGIQDAAEEFEEGPGRVAAVVVYCPPSDLLRLVESSAVDLLEACPALALEGDQFTEFSPIHHVSSNAPPTLILHGSQDEIVPIVEGESMHQVLQKSGVISKFLAIAGAGHGLLDDDADRALEETVAWFEEHLGVK
jgi:acetyl esterase/lipase